MTDEEYISLVSEVFDGYTSFDFHGQTVYLKHFSIQDQRHIFRYQNYYKNIALNKGLLSEKEILTQLRDDGLWSDEDDLKIITLESEIENLKITQRSIILPSQKDLMQKDITDKLKTLMFLKNKRHEVVGKTAEDYAMSRANEEFLRYIFYKDPACKIHLFTDEEFDALSDDDLPLLQQQNKICTDRFNDDNLQFAVLRNFFSLYLSQAENVADFYGKPLVQLSVYQLKLALYARIFNNIFQHVDGIPENIKQDPAAILRFAENKRSGNQASTRNKNQDKDGATTVFGATKSDLAFVDPNAKPIDLNSEIAKKGGSMNMEDLMKLMGPT